jgi:hypothetical protein
MSNVLLPCGHPIGSAAFRSPTEVMCIICGVHLPGFQLDVDLLKSHRFNTPADACCAKHNRFLYGKPCPACWPGLYEGSVKAMYYHTPASEGQKGPVGSPQCPVKWSKGVQGALDATKKALRFYAEEFFGDLCKGEEPETQADAIRLFDAHYDTLVWATRLTMEHELLRKLAEEVSTLAQDNRDPLRVKGAALLAESVLEMLDG